MAAAAPFMPLALVAAWLTVWMAIAELEQRVARRHGYVAADLPGVAVSFALSAMQAAAALALIQQGDGSARFFAVALIGFSSVNILLRFYAAPKMLLVTMAPHAAVLAWVCWGLTLTALTKGQLLRAVTPPATLSLYFLLIWPTRSRLMDAWLRLLQARRDAQEGRRVAEQASRAKSDFLALMSHEIRTPLNGILGMVQALQAGRPSKNQKTGLRVIRGCGETLLAILNDVLDLTKVEAGQLTIESEAFDLEHVTRGAVATFAPLAEDKGLAFSYSIEDTAKAVVRGDPVRLRQVLYNLVSNAVKFTEHGAVGVTVAYADGRVLLEIVDTGVGIPDRKLEAIFEDFEQADASTTRTRGGVGLGLAICRRVVELMGGSIRVSSQEGRGSIFTIALPMARLGEPEPLIGTETAVAAPDGSAALRVLAAEDNEVNRLVLSTLLKQPGVTLSLVQNGEQAVDAWRREPWDLILMDIRMPVMDGLAATRAIRAEERAMGRVRTPIVALTANAMPEQRADYEAAGMDRVVTKPIEISKLFAAIETVLQDASAEAA